MLLPKTKKIFKFTDLITNYKIVDYVNGNTLDLRQINMKEFGLKFSVVNKLKNTFEFEDNDTPHILSISSKMKNASKYYFMESQNLPKNKWILGSIQGTIFLNKIKTIIHMRIHDSDAKIRCQTFKISDYKSLADAMDYVHKYLINVAHKLCVVKNMIKINDNKTIDVKIDDDNIMCTDIVFLPLFIPIANLNYSSILSISKNSSSTTSSIYASSYNRVTKLQKSFHTLIMQCDMIDHINHNSLDNRLYNLRYTNYNHNNSNKSIHCLKNDNLITGVCKKQGAKYNYYEARLKYNNLCYSKIFSIPKLGDQVAKMQAIKFRKSILEINYNTYDVSDISFTKKDVYAIENAISRHVAYKNECDNKTIYDYNNYLSNLQLPESMTSLKKQMYYKYATIQAMRYFKLGFKIKFLQQLSQSIQKN